MKVSQTDIIKMFTIIFIELKYIQSKVQIVHRESPAEVQGSLEPSSNICVLKLGLKSHQMQTDWCCLEGPVTGLFQSLCCGVCGMWHTTLSLASRGSRENTERLLLAGAENWYLAEIVGFETSYFPLLCYILEHSFKRCAQWQPGPQPSMWLHITR